MKELSLNILDIAENSVKANATLVKITITESEEELVLTIADDGCGMKKEILLSVTDPFYTTRTTRKVGMGLPLLKFAAEQTGGGLTIHSFHKDEYPDEHGTTVIAKFNKNHIDFTPLGDAASSIVTLIQGHPDTDFLYKHTFADGKEVLLDTRELRAVLDDVPLDTFEVLVWIKDNLGEQYEETKK